jgi:hypothetical protein
MKTTLHLHHPPPPPPAEPAVRRPSTLRLGAVVSVIAALAAITVEAVADVPVAMILVPVVIVAFVLSWRASGRPLDGT